MPDSMTKRKGIGTTRYVAYSSADISCRARWQLTFASDFAEFARDFSIRIAADWPSVLLPFVHIFQFTVPDIIPTQAHQVGSAPLEAASSYPLPPAGASEQDN
jgi:hypothetical protein